MDDIDRQLLILLQNGIPLELRPFDKFFKKLKIDEADLLLRIQRLKDQGAVSRISAFLNPKSFGYRRALVAMRLSAELLDQAMDIIAEHPGISIASEVNHEINFWFSLALPPGHEFEEHIRKLHFLTGARGTILLPVVRSFKTAGETQPLDEDSFGDNGFESAAEGKNRGWSCELKPDEIACLRVLQEDLPLTDGPYRKWASGLRMHEADFLKTVNDLKARGFFSKIAAFVPLHKNRCAMHAVLAWCIPEERLEEISRHISSMKEVVSCCQRRAAPEFPYSLYVTVEVSTAQQCEEIALAIDEKIGPWPRVTLLNTAVRKKIDLRYFDQALDLWRDYLDASQEPWVEPEEEEAEAPQEFLDKRDDDPNRSQGVN